jgi:hypothetical protein
MEYKYHHCCIKPSTSPYCTVTFELLFLGKNPEPISINLQSLRELRHYVREAGARHIKDWNRSDEDIRETVYKRCLNMAS